MADPDPAGILARGGPLLTVAAEELGDLGLQRGLHQPRRAEPGGLFQDLRELLARSEQLVNVAADTLGRGYSVWHGRRSFPSMTWPSLKGTYARLHLHRDLDVTVSGWRHGTWRML